jgi:N-acetylglucosamine malate deacetylase 1
MNKVLVFSPHPDDITIGCGATINKFVEEGKEVWCVVLSPDGQGFQQGELENSITALGVPLDHIIVWDIPVRKFWSYQQQILDKMLDLRSTLAPELVLCHSSVDKHQDHESCTKACFRAFKNVSIWGYELGWNSRNFHTDIFVPLSKRNVDAKIKAQGFITSQGQRIYYDARRREAQMMFRGEQVGKEYCEAFENISNITE